MKFLLLTSIVLLTTPGLFAQEKLSEAKRSEFEAQKVAFLTRSLELSPQEATVFWPLYNEMQKEIRAQEDEKRTEIKRFREAQGITDKHAREHLEKLLDSEQKVLNIKKEYYNKLAEELPPHKISKLDWVERKFHRQLLDKMRNLPPPTPKNRNAATKTE